MYKSTKLTENQLMTLSLIIESPGISLQEIADSLADVFGKCQAESNVSSTIKVLKNKGFVVSFLQEINNRNRRLYYPSDSMKQQRKVITSHIHSRIANLSQKAIEKSLIVSCDMPTAGYANAQRTTPIYFAYQINWLQLNTMLFLLALFCCNC